MLNDLGEKTFLLLSILIDKSERIAVFLVGHYKINQDEHARYDESIDFDADSYFYFW